MSATVLSGKPVAEQVLAGVADRVAALAAQGRRVGLATLQVGDDQASQVYVRSKHRAAARVGMASFERHLPASATRAEVHEAILALNEDPDVDGFIVQLPLPAGLDAHAAVDAIDPAKDADGLHPYNLGLLAVERPASIPATPQGVMEMLAYYDIPLAGRLAVVVGRSFLVGKPLALLLGAKGTDATVVQAHSRTTDLEGLTRQADLLVAAIGRPRFLGAGHVKPGATVVDVGINRTPEGLVGDVDYETVAGVAGAITPVPGGVGPMTVACLLRNTVGLAARRFSVG